MTKPNMSKRGKKTYHLQKIIKETNNKFLVCGLPTLPSSPEVEAMDDETKRKFYKDNFGLTI